MITKWFLVMVVTSTLWTTCLSQSECTSTIFNISQIIFTCLSNVIIDELPLYNYTTNQLANIISIVVNGPNNTTPGPFTSIPPNICLLPNLQSIDFSYNRISQVDPAGVLSGCLSSVMTLDVSYNNISEFPSAMIYNMPTVQNLYFQHNQLINVPSNAFSNISNLNIIDFSYNLLTNFELWASAVQTSADFSNNQISTITNNLFFNISQYPAAAAKIYLTNNSATINLTDAIFEMYSTCSEVYDWLFLSASGADLERPILGYAMAFISFGTTQINCSCDQSYTVQMISQTFATWDFSLLPIYNATCIGGTRFIDSSCNSGTDPPNSSVDFSKVYPRQCKISPQETGNLTNIPNISVPTINASTYPHYQTELMNPGACFFTFSNTITVEITCTNEVSNSSTIPSALLSTTYFSGVIDINFAPTISSLPSYLCSLPSRQIDLSFESFTTLSDGTFPCLDRFLTVKLAYNQLTSVNMSSGNFTNLTSLDLSSNRLTTIPYSLLIPTPSSLRYLDLRNNSITSIDLFLYTLKNITVDLRDNPINSLSIINPQNITLPSGNNTNSTVTITLPLSVTNSTYIFNDQTALTAGTCDVNAVLPYLNTLRSTYTSVLLDCTCSSINLKEIFLRGGADITNSFNCSSGSTAANFSILTMSSCASTALNFSSGLCYNESLQTSTNNTTIGSLSTTVQITSTSLTVLLINSSLSSHVTQNQSYTTLPAFEETSLDLYTLQTTNTSKQLSTIYVETTTSKNSSYSDVTSSSSTNSSNEMATSSSINTTTASMNTTITLSTTSSLSSTLLIIDTTTTMLTDSNMTTSSGWTTTTTTTTTSTSTSTSTSTTSTTTSRTTSTSSTSTTTTSATTTSTSTTSTTTSRTTSTSSTSTSTSTSTTSTTTSQTTSTSSTSTSTSTSTTTTTTSRTTSTSSTSTSTSTSTTTTTTSVTTTSTSTTSTTTSRTTSTSSTSTSTSISTSITSITTVTTTITMVANTSDEVVQSSGGSSTNRTGLIVGLVLGLVGFFALVGGLIAAVVITKSKGAAAMNKPVGRATALSQAPQNALLESRLQTRNLRSVRLAPLTTQPSQLPKSSKGIPARLDPIRSPTNVVPQYTPNSYTSKNASNFRPVNNSPTNQNPLLQQHSQEPKFGQSTICSIDTTHSSQLILTCPNGTSLNELPFSSADMPWLSNITSFLAQGENNTRGPFTSIPSNICWMSNLTTLNLTYNQLGNTLNFSSFLNCSISWKIVDLSYNYLTAFPSTLFTLNRFDSVYLNNNQLTSIDLSIVALVQDTVDLRNNAIKSVINPTNFNISLGLETGDTLILLDGNPMLQLNDTIYEMYGSCNELEEGFAGTLDRSSLTIALGNIDFGSTEVNCSCDQYYILEMLQIAFGVPVLGRISHLLCANEPITFVDYTCSLGYSTINFTQVQPRLCQLDDWNMTTTTIFTTSTSTVTVTTTLTTSTATTSSTSPTTSTSTATTVTTATITTSSTTSTKTTSSTTTTSSTASTTTTTVTTTSSTSSTSSSTTSTKTTSSTTTTSSTVSTTTTTTSTTSSTSSSTTTTATTTSTTSSTSSSTTTTVTITSTTSSTSSTTTSTATTTSSTASTTTTTATTTSTTSSTSSSTTTTATTTSTTSSTSSSTTSTATTTSSTASTTTTTVTTTSTTSSTSSTASTTTTAVTTTSTTSSTSSTTTTTAVTTTSTTSSTSSTTTTTATTTSTTSSTSSTTTTTATTTSTTSSTSSTTTTTATTTSTTSSTSSTTTSTQTTSTTSSTSSTTTTTAATTSTTSSTSSTTTTTATTTSTTSSTSSTTTTTATTTSTTSSTSSTTTTTATTTSTTSSTSSTTTSTQTTSTTSSTSSTTTTTAATTSTTSSTSSTTTTTATTTSTTSSTSSTSTSTETTSSTTTTSSTSSTTTTTATTTSTTSSTSSTTTSTQTTSTTSSSSSTTTTTATTTSTTSSTSSTSTSTETTSSTTTTSSTSSTTTTTATTTSTTSSTSSTTTSTQTTSTTSSTSSTTTTTATTTSTTSSTSSTTTSTQTTSSTTITITSISIMNTSTCLTTFSISNTNLLLTCPSNANLSLLPINNYALTSLDRIISLTIEGYNGARGPLETLPPNICFLSNLQVLNISFNRLNHLDSSFLSSNPSCLLTLRTLDMSNNYLNTFPSLFLTITTNLRQLFLQNNQLTSFDLALSVLVSTSINLSNNQISKITNNANINISTYVYSLDASIDLTNNSQIIDLTDAVYEMYGACYEIQQILNTSLPSITPLLTISFLNINFGTSKINCTCNQYYLQKSFIYSFGNSLPSTYPLSNAMCTDGTSFYNNNKTAACSTSSVNFTNTIPRLCNINPNAGNIVLVNTTDNITGIYPYYLTQTMNNSYCLFTFYIGGNRVSIGCINGSSTLTEISLSILNTIYFQNITQVLINNQSSLSQLPSYLCSLPSTSIDLSNESFVILDKNSFPCLSNTTLQNINLSYNQISIINLTLFNWILIDLTSNNLTQLPYSLLSSNQNPTSSRQLSQRNLLLQLNKLTEFDLFIYTYVNTYVDLENNPFSKTINGYNILNNYQKQSLQTGPVSTNIILPNQMSFLLNDEIAQNYNTCDSRSLNYLIEIFQYMKKNNITVEIQCQCSSIYIKEYFSLLNSSEKITNQFSCSNNTSSLTEIQFESLTETDCLSNITLSPDRLCQFARIESSPLSSNPISKDNGQLLAVILGSVLGSVGFLFIIALILGGIWYKRKSSVKTAQISVFSRNPNSNNDRPEENVRTRNTRWLYNLPPIDDRTISRLDSTDNTIDHPGPRTEDVPSYYLNSADLSQQENNQRQKRRRRLPKEPPIDYETNSRIFRIEDPSSISSNV